MVVDEFRFRTDPETSGYGSRQDSKTFPRITRTIPIIRDGLYWEDERTILVKETTHGDYDGWSQLNH